MDSSIFSPVPRSSHIVVLDWWRPSSQAAPLICGSENGRIGNCGAVISVDELHERYDDRGGLFNRIHLTEGVPLRIKKTFEIQRVNTHCYSLSSSWCVYYKGNKSFFFLDPSGCLLHTFGSTQRCHEYYIEAQEGEKRRAELCSRWERKKVQEKETNKRGVHWQILIASGEGEENKRYTSSRISVTVAT